MARFYHLIDHLRENAVGAAVDIYVNSSIVFLQTVSVMLLAAVVKEDENEKLGGKENIINHIVTFLKKALESPKRRHSGFAPNELLLGLDRLSAYDANKQILIDKDIIPLLTELLCSEVDLEREYAAKVLWSLSFNDDGKKIINQESKSDLTQLANKGTGKDSKNAKGCLWTLEGKTEEQLQELKKHHENQSANKKIFISYSWAFQKVIVNLAKSLQEDGYEVWLDIEQMTGSTLEKMAEGIEESGLIIVALSESYKMSPNCRAEAEYMFKLEKPFIPIMTQRGYKPDGWLGMLTGSKLYINFDGKYDFKTAFEKLRLEIGRISATEKKPIVQQTALPTGSG